VQRSAGSPSRFASRTNREPTAPALFGRVGRGAERRGLGSSPRRRREIAKLFALVASTGLAHEHAQAVEAVLHLLARR